MASSIITFKANASFNELIEVRALIAHPMETGFRTNDAGKLVGRNIIENFTCQYRGALVIEMSLNPSIAANPYIRFFVRAQSTGPLEFIWRGQHGFEQREMRTLTVGD
jgi:sulfur-oxidizing protein SoxZ